MMKFRMGSALLFFFLLQVAVNADVVPVEVVTEVVTMEEMVVSAEKPSVGVAEGNYEQIDVEVSPGRIVTTVPELLKHTSGIDVQPRGVLTPKNTSVRLRGLDESRFLMLLDGRPLNGTGVMGGYFVDWSMIPLMPWEAVEVSKGAFSAKYGNNLGGMINLIPKKPSEELELEAQAGYGIYDTFDTAGYGQMRWGSFGGAVTAGYVKTDGNLRNSEAERQNVSGSLYYFPGQGGEVRFSFRHVIGDFNMPVTNKERTPGYDDDFPETSGKSFLEPSAQFPTGDKLGDGSYSRKKRTELDLAFHKEVLGVETKAVVYFNDEERRDKFYSYNLEELVLEREGTPDRSWGWLAHFNKPWEKHIFGWGASGNYQGQGKNEVIREKSGYFTIPNTDGAEDWDSTRWHGVYVDDQWSVLSNLDLYFGLRYDHYQGDRTARAVKSYDAQGKVTGYEDIHTTFGEDAAMPKLGVVFRPFDKVSLHGRVARATRFPDNPAFVWYYYGYRPEVDPNSTIVRKELTFEDAIEYETGISVTPIPEVTLSLNYYVYRVDDYIRVIRGYAPSRLVYNIDRVDLRGLEWSVKCRLRKNIFAFGNFTYQTTEKSGDVMDAAGKLSDRLSELPEVKANWGVRYERQDGALAELLFRWVGERDVPVLMGTDMPDGAPPGKPVALEKLHSFCTLDLFFEYPVWDKEVKGILSFGVKNLLDKDYDEEYDIPAPGRVFSGGIELKF